MPNLFIDTIKGIPKAAGDLATSLFKGSIFDNSKPTPTLRFKIGENLNPQQTNIARQIIRKKTTTPVSNSFNMDQALNILTNRNIKDPAVKKEAFSSLSAPIMGASSGLENTIGKTVKPLAEKVAPKLFTGFEDLTTRVLDSLKGKSSVSKQYIEDLTNQGSLRQSERDIVRNTLDQFKGDKIPVDEFANKVKTELLPLKIRNSLGSTNNLINGRGTVGSVIPRYESISLPTNIRGDVANYSEHIYESPIKTSAASTHFSDTNFPNYFAHTRVEDMAGGKTRRVIEIQSDLMQKEGLNRESIGTFGDVEALAKKNNLSIEEASRLQTEQHNKKFIKLKSYRNTWYERIIREEIKKASQDGKTELQFPTGETAINIEGLGDKGGKTETWFTQPDAYSQLTNMFKLNKDDLKVGKKIYKESHNINKDDVRIITDVLSDGKFKAVPKRVIDEIKSGKTALDRQTLESVAETFDISSKTKISLLVEIGKPKISLTPDNIKEVISKINKEIQRHNKNSPEWNLLDTSKNKATIYKFYEKDINKFLKKFGGKQITDSQGVTWNQIPITKDIANKPVLAQGKASIGAILASAGVGTGIVGASKLIKFKDKKSLFTNSESQIPRVQSTRSDKYGIIDTLNVGTKSFGDKVDKFIPTEVRPPSKRLQDTIDETYRNNPGLPAGLLRALLMKESSMGSDTKDKNPDIGEFAYLTGITKIGKKELIRNGIVPDLNTHAGVLQATADLWNIRKDLRNSDHSIRHTYNNITKWYNERYSSGKLSPEDLLKFSQMYEYYSHKKASNGIK